VIDLAVPFHTAVTAAQIRDAFTEHPAIDFVSLVHAEAATGNTNPVAEIGEAVRAHGALFSLDAVASVGAEPVLPDAWGVDLCVIGAQKAMGGPAGVSAISVSDRAWARMAANPRAPRRSYLSLLDWKERWIDGGRRALLHAPAQLEMLALEACLERIEKEGLDAVTARHASAAAATRAGVLALGGGLEPYVHDAADAAPVATTLRTPAGVDAAELVAEALAVDPALPLAAGGGALASEMIRVNHYGPDATPEAVDACLAALGTALAGCDGTADPEAARRAAADAWARA
jgi:aspartate aminotransferase-like enzyme